MKSTALMISCEHGGYEIPAAYRHLFSDLGIVETHRGWDIGALLIAEELHRIFACSFVKTTVSRLLIDCNRSLNNIHCFSEFTQCLSPLEKQQLINEFYLPYRQEGERLIQEHIERGQQVLHLSVHTFAPQILGKARNAAIGLLYDPKRHGEKEVAREWYSLLLKQSPAYRIRLNYPYQGISDGFTRVLRKKHSESDYLGFEIECNQILVTETSSLKQLIHAICNSVEELITLL